MHNSKPILVSMIFGIPLLLGVGIVGYWFYTVQIEKQTLLPVFGEVPQFSLISEQNKSVSNKDLMGRITVADFIFTECGGSCPVMSTKMADLQSTFANDTNVRFVSFSVDPETDTPDVLATYGHQYKALPGKWTFLTGKKDTIYSLTKKGFHLGLDIEGEGAILHSEKFVLIDHHGSIRGYYDSNEDEEMKLLLRDIRALSRRVSA